MTAFEAATVAVLRPETSRLDQQVEALGISRTPPSMELRVPVDRLSRDGGNRWFRTELCEQGVHSDDAISVIRERTDGFETERFISFGERDADAARLFLVGTPASMVFQDGQSHIIPPRKAMQTEVRDLRPSLHWRADHALDLVSFVMPRTALARWAEEADIRSFHGLVLPAPEGPADEVIAGFGLSLLHCLDHPQAAPRLFVDEVLHSVCGYLVRTFGSHRQPARRKGGLAPWQERRAKDMISANLTSQLSLQALAAECRLSISHFTKAFRETLGQSPHQWLLERRVEHARTLLATTGLSLPEIAATCGFADQSHFSRAFTKRTATSPGAWRRAQAGAAR